MVWVIEESKRPRRFKLLVHRHVWGPWTMPPGVEHPGKPGELAPGASRKCTICPATQRFVDRP